MVVEILCGVLAGAAFSTLVYPTGPRSARSCRRAIGHFFGAIRIDAFRPLDEFKADMDELIRSAQDRHRRPKAQSRIYVAGEKEFEKEEERRREGIPLHPKVDRRNEDRSATAWEFVAWIRI